MPDFTLPARRFNLNPNSGPISTREEEILNHDFRAVIFDFNGVIVNDEPLHCELLREVICEEGMLFNDGDYERYYLGRNDLACFRSALQRHHHPRLEDPSYVNSLVSRKTDRYQATIRQQDLLFPGVAELVAGLALTHPLAIASGALRAEIELVLTRAGIGQCFQLIVAAEDVRNSKPDPEGFLKAWQGLRKPFPDLRPAECLVIEDSVAGVTAAKAAGMQCLAVSTSFPASALHQADQITPELTAWFRRP
jgi:beta-phosphoglucomutase